MKRILLFMVVLLGIFAFKPASNSVHQFKVEAIDGSQIELSSFKGKKILIVNTASKCGFTKQYKELEELYKQYKDKLVIIGFPSNDFNQEKGSNAEIAEFCEKNYGVTFPLAGKINVKGKDAAPIYQWLTQKAKNGVMDANVAWNFNKFLLDENGVLIQHYGSMVKPLSENITKYLN